MYDAGTLHEVLIYFEEQLKAIAGKYTNLFEKEVGLGLMRGLRAKDAQTVSAILEKSMQEGLIVLKAGRNTVRFLPSLTITKEEIDEGFKRFEKALDSL
jgi:acetylornithine aminotransferase